MKKILKYSLLACIFTFLFVNGRAAADSTSVPKKKFYWTSDMDWAIFSSSIMEKTPGGSRLTTLRFSYFPNIGLNFNFDLNNHIGLYTGINMKNIGFIEKVPLLDSTIKRRVLTIGIPLAIKVGNFSRHNFGFAGGGVDVPFNYKEKGYIRRGNKDKFNEWFSDRTPRFMPYIFAGIARNPFVVKLQYYPGSFLNSAYTERINVVGGPYTVAPYSSYTKVNLMLLSVGFDIRYSKKKTVDSDDDEPAKQTM